MKPWCRTQVRGVKKQKRKVVGGFCFCQRNADQLNFPLSSGLRNQALCPTCTHWPPSAAIALYETLGFIFLRSRRVYSDHQTCTIRFSTLIRPPSCPSIISAGSGRYGRRSDSESRVSQVEDRDESSKCNKLGIIGVDIDLEILLLFCVN